MRITGRDEREEREIEMKEGIGRRGSIQNSLERGYMCS